MNEKRRELLKAAGLSVGAAVALGFSRFAYATLLLPIREALGWKYVAASSVNTGIVAWQCRALGRRMAGARRHGRVRLPALSVRAVGMS